MRYIKVPVQLLDELAPEEPMNQDEQGGCVWCGGMPPVGWDSYAGRVPEDHQRDCPWLLARRILEPDATDLRPSTDKLTKPQQALLDRLRHYTRMPVRGADLRVAEALNRKQLVRLVDHGTPWTKGWWREVVIEE